MISHIITRALMIAFFIVSASHCATVRDAQVREERSISIGFLGAGYRPNANWGVGVTGSFTSDSSNGGIEFKESNNRDIKIHGQSIGLSIIRFPWATSAFCFGLGIKKGAGEVSFNAETVGSATETTRVKYSRSAVYLGVPVGWYWIWENGMTLALNLGPNFRMAHETSISESGGANVNASKRDDFIDSTEKANRVTFGGFGLIGYSF